MAFIIDTINGSGLYAQSAASASVATYDSNGNVITATYLTGVDLTPYQTTAGMTAYATTGDVANKLDTTAFSDVSGTFLTAHQPISADEWNDVYNTVNINSGSWTGSESSPTASVDSNGSIDIVSSNNTVYFDVNGTWFNNAVNSAVDVPTGVMVESACEYNAVNEISGYNGSAIAQYGADKQWLQHDDTIVHVANSAQYAFGCNVSALQRLMGIDETVLWEGSANTTATTGTLSESLENFNTAKIYTRVVNSTDRASIITTVEPRYGDWNYTLMYFPNYTIGGGTTTENTMYLQVFRDKTFKLLAGSKWVNGTYTQSVTAYDFAMTKIVGIGRKQ